MHANIWLTIHHAVPVTVAILTYVLYQLLATDNSVKSKNHLQNTTYYNCSLRVHLQQKCDITLC